MSYKIQYDITKSNNIKWIDTGKRKRKIVIFSFLLLVFFGIIALRNLEFLQELLFPGDAAVTRSAMDTLISNIKDGQSFSNAITVFCQEIIDAAKVSS